MLSRRRQRLKSVKPLRIGQGKKESRRREADADGAVPGYRSAAYEKLAERRRREAGEQKQAYVDRRCDWRQGAAGQKDSGRSSMRGKRGLVSNIHKRPSPSETQHALFAALVDSLITISKFAGNAGLTNERRSLATVSHCRRAQFAVARPPRARRRNGVLARTFRFFVGFGGSKATMLARISTASVRSALDRRRRDPVRATSG